MTERAGSERAGTEWPDKGQLLANLVHFARTLRAAGLPVGPGKVLDAVEAVLTVGLERRDDFYWALHAVFVNRGTDRLVFNQTFHLFWRNPNLLQRALGVPLPDGVGDDTPGEPLNRRVAEAMAGRLPAYSEQAPDDDPPTGGVAGFSPEERLAQKDFEAMSAAELAEARRAIADFALVLAPVRTRRYERHGRGARVSLRHTLRRSLRGGGNALALEFARPRTRIAPLVIVCDISGSMSRYSRMCLHLAHALMERLQRVDVFVFGTRLTPITRQLRNRDVDVALARVGAAAGDFDGGTRIGHCLRTFNRAWSRRVLGQGATVLLITDGLDRDAGEGLELEMERLHKSCRRLICLNPLLRYDGYEPRTRGIQAILPHVDQFSSVHNLNSMAELVAALAKPPARAEEGKPNWVLQAN